MCQLQLLFLVILLITVSVSHNVIYFEYFMLMSHGAIRRLLELSPPTLPLAGFHQACCFTSNTLSTFFCSDVTDYCKHNAFSK